MTCSRERIHSSFLNLEGELDGPGLCMRARTVLILGFIVILIAQNTLPAFAHYLLGRQTGTAPFRVHDSDLSGHVPGVTGYVWPGAGLATLDPNNTLVRANPFADNLIGYRPPLASVETDRGYSPVSSIIASTSSHSSKGDLILAINFTCPEATPVSDDFTRDSKQESCIDFKQDVVFKSIMFYVPPEFQPPVNWGDGDASNIVTTVTNDYQMIQVAKSDGWDPFGPYWWTILIRGQITFSLANHLSEWYYVRLNEMTAPPDHRQVLLQDLRRSHVSGAFNRP